MKRKLLYTLTMTLLTGLLSGCQALTGLYFFPERGYRLTPDKLNLAWQPVELKTRDNIILKSWWLPAQPNPDASDIRGTILFLHGNAENISTHIHSIAWLPRHSYNVFMLDYRGFGYSSGKPGLPDVFLDIDASASWLLAQDSVQQKPLYLLGQSIGGALGATWISQAHNQDAFSAVVLDAPFASWPGMARYAISRQWQTWPFLPGTFLIPSQWDAERHVEKLKKPLLVIHTLEDEISPVAQSRKLYDKSLAQKQWLETKGPHIATFGRQESRTAVLQFLQEHQDPAVPP